MNDDTKNIVINLDDIIFRYGYTKFRPDIEIYAVIKNKELNKAYWKYISSLGPSKPLRYPEDFKEQCKLFHEHLDGFVKEQNASQV